MTTYSGYVALIGRPNVGKSTLLNRILDQKISITSRKPQTTRHRILGIQTIDNYQAIYVDTPGIHDQSKKALNRLMNKTAKQVLFEVDLIIFIVESNYWHELDEAIINLINTSTIPCVLAINKVDKLAHKDQLLPLIKNYSQKHNFAAVVPISAKLGTRVKELETVIKNRLPESVHYFSEDQISDRPVKFFCAELIREKIFRFCGQELPYSTIVDIESFEEQDDLIKIHALILVDKASHKQMIIGTKGEKLKEMATYARLDMEKFLDKKVFLRCWCKIKSNWANDERLLNQLGI